jgi:hypothetical protein
VGAMTKIPAAERPLSEAQREVLDTAPLAELTDAKAWLLTRGQGVTPPAVATAVLDARQRALSAPAKAAKAKRDKAERQAFKAELRQDTDRLGRCAAKVVAIALEQHGRLGCTAPTWSELGRAMGWSWWQWNRAVPRLAKRGWLVTGTEPRSIRPGPKWGKT